MTDPINPPRIRVLPNRRCEVCGAGIATDMGRCTNGRCHACHAAHCTSGGITGPGHGRGTVTALFRSDEPGQQQADEP